MKVKFADKENVPPIDKRLFNAVLDACPEGGTILELGSGITTAEFAKHRKIYSIEHDPFWVGANNEIQYYRFVPVTKRKDCGFYNRAALGFVLKHLKYDVLLVDGPDTEDRIQRFCERADMFDKTVDWFFDDVAYPNYHYGVISVRRVRDKKMIIDHDANKKWGVIRAD